MNSVSPFHWHRRIGMRDVDAWGVVWHGNYFAYCDEARSELLRAFDLAPGTLVSRGYVAPVIDAQCRFVAPARFDEEIDVFVRLSLGRGTRVHFEFAIHRSSDQKRVAQIATTQVLVKTNGELVYFIPDDLKQLFDRMLAAQPTPTSPESS